MAATYLIRLMFEWGGGCLWCGNDATLKQFDVGPIEDLLPLPFQTRRRLKELSAWHDRSLNWEDPPDPRPWSAREFERIDEAAKDVLETVRSELGPEFDVVYVPL